MTGICGIICFDHAPIEENRLSKLIQAGAHRCAYLTAYQNLGPAYMAYLQNSCYGPQNIHQPVVFQDRFILVADARLDYRDDLERKLTTLDIFNNQPLDDAQIIACAYLKWGIKCLEYLEGDFAFVLWDQKERRIFAARDRSGARVIYYRLNHVEFQWATEAAQLLSDSAYSVTLNEESIAHSLGLIGVGAEHDVFYKDIYKLAPGEQLIWENETSYVSEYWDFLPKNETRFASDEQYAQRFLELFQAAILTRMRGHSSFGFMMSGGLDSTSIAAVAARMVQKGLAPEQSACRLVTWDTDVFPEHQEFERSKSVAEMYSLPIYRMVVDSLWPFFDYPTRQPHQDDPFDLLAYGPFEAALQLYDPGPTLWFWGHPGDMLVGGSNPYYYWQLFRNGKLLRMHGEIKSHSQKYQIPVMDVYKEDVIHPLLSPWIRPVLFHLRSDQSFIPGWISKDLAKRTHLGEWIKNTLLEESKRIIDWGRQAGGIDRAIRYRYLKFNMDVWARTWANRTAMKYRTQIVSPFDDSRLASYVLSIPQTQLAEGIDHKLLLRVAMTDYLPDQVRNRHGRRIGAPVALGKLFNTLQAKEKICSLLSHSKAAELNVIDMRAFEAAINLVYDGKVKMSASLFLGLCLERWVQIWY